MTIPLNVKFSTTTADYDLLQDADIVTKIKGHLGESIYNSITKGNALVSFTVFVESPTQIKFKTDGAYCDFIKDVVFSSNGVTLPSKLIIKDTGISGTLSLQVQ